MHLSNNVNVSVKSNKSVWVQNESKESGAALFSTGVKQSAKYGMSHKTIFGETELIKDSAARQERSRTEGSITNNISLMFTLNPFP